MTETIILGCGAVGSSLAAAMRRVGWPLIDVWTRSQARAQAAGLQLGQPVSSGPLPATLARADLVLLCVRDDVISALAKALAGVDRLRAGVVVAHTSGCLPAAALGPVANASLGSFHPLTVFSPGELTALDGCAVALEGEATAVALLKQLANAVNGESVLLAAADKPRYHAAAVIASSLMLALLDLAGQEATAAGVDDASRHLGHLARATLASLDRRSFPAALTGPLVRGDLGTVTAHLQALSPAAQPVYGALSRRLLARIDEPTLDGKTKARLAALLEGLG